MKAAIEDVFNRVAVALIHVHPSHFFGIVYQKIFLGDKLAGEGGARQKPPKLDAEDQEETVDVARNVFMYLDAATFKRVLEWEVTLAPAGTVTVVIAVNVATRTAAKTTTGGRSILVRHVAGGLFKTEEVDSGRAVSEGASAAITPAVTRSAQIKHAVSVHQGSLIHKACMCGVGWACMNVVCCSENCARVW